MSCLFIVPNSQQLSEEGKNKHYCNLVILHSFNKHNKHNYIDILLYNLSIIF